MKIHRILTLFCCLLAFQSFSQGWQRIYDGDNDEIIIKADQMPTGEFLTTGMHQIQTVPDPLLYHYFIQHINTDGELLWQLDLPDFESKFAQGGAEKTTDQSLILPNDNGFDFLAFVSDDGGLSNNGLVKAQITSNGVLESFEILPTTQLDLRFLHLLQDGNFLVLGDLESPDWSSVQKRSLDGTVIWETILSIPDPDNSQILELSNQQIVVFTDLFYSVLSPSGDLLSQEFTSLDTAYPNSLWEVNTDSLLGYGATAEGPASSAIYSIDPHTATVGNYFIPIPDDQEVQPNMLLLEDGSAVLFFQRGVFANAEFRLLKYSPTGEQLWDRTFDLFKDLDAQGLILLEDNGFLLYGGVAGSDGIFDPVLIRTDSLGRINSNLISGYVYLDEDLNCIYTNPELPLEGWTVFAFGDGFAYGSSDSSGYYELPVGIGEFTVQLFPPTQPDEENYWDFCNLTETVEFTDPFQFEEIDFGAQIANPDCPYPFVDIATPFLRRCFNNDYIVTYCNYGTTTIENGEVTVILDPYLEYIDSELPPVSQQGDTLVFEVGDIEIGDCGNFKITTYVNCDDTVLGQTHCVQAYLSPTDNCDEPEQNWDGSTIEVEGICEGDSIIFTITNIGEFAMSQELNYIVVEDQIILITGPFDLDPGEMFTLVIYPDGEEITLIADQSPGNPYFSFPSISVVGCNSDDPTSVIWSLEFPENDDAPYYAIDCRENIGAYDPNDKTPSPFGYGEDNLIEDGIDLNYHIRFQNTGTDTAFRVVIRDTLSEYLNPNRLAIGSASHPFTWNLSGEGILEFIFDDILLPDSTTNEPGSHGFVNFRIQVDQDLPIGTQILNEAAIFFDFNEPIITNMTLHTIGDPFTNTSTQSVSLSLPGIQLAPNPSPGIVYYNLEDIPMVKTSIDVYSKIGHRVLSQPVRHKEGKLDLGSRPAGWYLVVLKENGEVKAVEKLLVIK